MKAFIWSNVFSLETIKYIRIKCLITTALLSILTINAQPPTSRLVMDQASDMTRKLNHKPLGLSFPPVSSVEDLRFTREHAQALGVSSVRFAENWRIRESTENQFTWDGLDRRMDSLHAAGLQIFLTIESDGPAWRCGASNARSCAFTDLGAFRAYVTALCLRYRGRLAYLQFGNEAYSEYWYAGTAADFIAAANVFYEAVKVAAPEVPVVLAGMQTQVPHLLSVCTQGRAIPSRNEARVLLTRAQAAAQCADPLAREILHRFDVITAGAKYDLVDVHLYDDAEYWFDYLEILRLRLPGKTFLASEIGAPNKRYEPLDDTYHASRITTILGVLPLLGLHEAYYFQLVEYPASQDAEHEKSGLIGRPEMDIKPAYELVRAYNLR